MAKWGVTTYSDIYVGNIVDDVEVVDEVVGVETNDAGQRVLHRQNHRPLVGHYGQEIQVFR